MIYFIIKLIMATVKRKKNREELYFCVVVEVLRPVFKENEFYSYLGIQTGKQIGNLNFSIIFFFFTFLKRFYQHIIFFQLIRKNANRYMYTHWNYFWYQENFFKIKGYLKWKKWQNTFIVIYVLIRRKSISFLACGKQDI